MRSEASNNFTLPYANIKKNVTLDGMKSRAKEQVRIAGLLALLLILSAGSFLFWKDKFTPALSPIEQTLPLTQEGPREPEPEIFTLMFVGDIMLNRGVSSMVNTKGNEDWRWPFFLITEELKRADFLFGNLESVISDKGARVGSAYSFRADPASLQGLLYAGFDMVSAANNHSMDYTGIALADSFNRLNEAGIQYAGAGTTREEAHSPAVFKLPDGTALGILAYTAVGSAAWEAGEANSGIAWMDSSRLDILQTDITQAKKEADILIVSFHFGEEYQKTPGDLQRELAEAAINEGTQLVIGHHSHVVQPIERYKDGWIAYSLGNFVFDQEFSEETMRGTILQVEVQDKKIQKVELVPTKQNSAFQAEFAE